MKKKVILLPAVCLSIMIWMPACKKDAGTATTVNVNPQAVNADVYVAGSEFNGTVYVAKLWKNGTAYNVSDGTKNATATGVSVNGSNVYVSFTDNTSGRKRAKLWKNGIETTLSFPDINDPFVESAANGIYNAVVAGYYQTASTGRSVAVYWDDNGSKQLSNPAANNAEANGLHIKTINNFTRTSVSGNIETNNNGVFQQRAFFFGNQFSNPSLNILSGEQTAAYGHACYINDNGFTYTAGRLSGLPTVWFEGGTYITLSNSLGFAYGIYVSGYTQVYAVGSELVNGKYIARLWSGDYQTGQLKSSSLGSGQYQSNATGVQVIDGNTFISGDEYDGTGKTYAKYWKNGIPVIVGGPSSYANAIYVVKK
ncbi:MAG TPA: hypothetical protein VL307_13365 [Chitinophagaceae bacterium]|jgi:hypothetical protein|nr:hypothetical protein [Chitinophagaceae bacterium]